MRFIILIILVGLLTSISIVTGAGVSQNELPQPLSQQTVGLFIKKNNIADGYVLFAPIMSDTTYLIDNDGNLINSWHSSSNPALSVYLLENGNLLRTGNARNNSFSGGGGGGRLEEIDWDGNIVWQYTYSSTTYLSHHDVEMLPNGNILMIAWEKKGYNDAISAGCNPSFLTDNELWTEHIIEIKPSGSTGASIVWQWHLWDHLVQDYDISKANYGMVSEHPGRLDINYSRRAAADWNHFNSIDYNAQLDQILISCRGTSEIYIIDHSTTTNQAASSSGGKSGKGGDLLYRWGNPSIYDNGSANDQLLFGQHDATWIDSSYPGGGNILIFNNGQRRLEGDYSSIDEITPPVDANGFYYMEAGNRYGTSSLSWQYIAPTPEDFYADHISGAQRLSNGNTLICSGTDGTFFEVTTNGEMVWKYINPVTESGILSQGEPIPSGVSGQRNSVFRCYRYAPSFNGFSGKTMSSLGPLVETPVNGGEAAPFGKLDSPMNGATVSSSVAVTGWALDDLAVESVKLYRSPVSGEISMLAQLLSSQGPVPMWRHCIPVTPTILLPVGGICYSQIFFPMVEMGRIHYLPWRKMLMAIK
jgi:Arylsulfotransferase (ASST)